MTKDQIELLRPGFEAAIIERFKESGFLEVEIRVECLTRCGDSYNDPQVAIAWWSWTQSRESLVVELPPEAKQPEGDGLDCDDVEVWEMQSEAAYAVNGMRQACKSAILNGGGGIREADPDGEALRLAVSLGLTVATGNGRLGDITEVYMNSSLLGRSEDGCAESHGDDAMAATRLTINRAAAKLPPRAGR